MNILRTCGNADCRHAEHPFRALHFVLTCNSGKGEAVMEKNTRRDSDADQDVHLSADDLAGVVEALTGERVIARPAQTRPARDVSLPRWRV
ncbi:hypothetical protein RW1_006_02350 [Rhodococcus wratislaviensis NBRC 100605]|uniref:Uncharacterized protein n=1 Tax=Rhodococcus wratislaviensis NBRC 100605 TaxID=1219028 RepID=X0PZR5_RHOWR|nr:hypothetical protein RW1_006_02350 [Rhodococcus wratislaviensis NBRC 100605]